MLMQKLVLIAPVVTSAVLYLLLGLSVLSIGVIIERWWFFVRRRADVAQMTDDLRKALRLGGVSSARELLKESRSVEAEIIGEALDWHGQGADAVEQIV